MEIKKNRLHYELQHNFREIAKERDDVLDSAESCVKRCARFLERRTLQCLSFVQEVLLVSKYSFKKNEL